MSFPNPPPSSSPDSIELELKRKLTSACRLAMKHGRSISPYGDLTWPKFRSLHAAQQLDVLHRVTVAHNIFASADESGVDFDDDRSMTWWALQQFGLRPPSDLFGTITDDQVLEIYNHDLVQIYRNWKFFEISSYSMGDLFVYPWPDLYVREEAVTQDLISRSVRTLKGEPKTTDSTPSALHVVTETLSARHHNLEMQVKTTAPLFDKLGQIAALAAISHVRKLTASTGIVPSKQPSGLRLVSP